MDLEKGDIVCVRNKNQFLHVTRIYTKHDGSSRFECWTPSNHIHVLKQEDIFLYCKKRDVSYQQDDLVYAWHNNNFCQAKIIEGRDVNSQVRFIDSNTVEFVSNNWIYPSSYRSHLGSSVVHAAPHETSAAVSDDGYETSFSNYDSVLQTFAFGYEECGGFKDDPLPESETIPLRTNLPAMPNKTRMIFSRLTRENKKKDSLEQDCLKGGYESPYEKQDPMEQIEGKRAAECIITTNKGRSGLGKKRGYFLPGSIYMFQFNRGAWSVYSVLISTCFRKEKGGYFEFRVCVLELLTEQKVGIWCKCFKCHKNTIVATQFAPEEVQNIFRHYAQKFLETELSVVPQTMPLALNMDARYCYWCKLVEVIEPAVEERDLSEESVDLFEIDSGQHSSKKQRISFGGVAERLVSTPSFQCLWPFSFHDVFKDIYKQASYALRTGVIKQLTRDYFLELVSSDTAPPCIYSFLPDTEADREFAQIASYFLNTPELAIYLPGIGDFNHELAKYVGLLMDVEDEIFAIVWEKPSRIHVLEIRGSCFRSRREYQHSAFSIELEKLLRLLGVTSFTVYSYQLPEQYHAKTFVWEHCVVMLIILLDNLKRGSDHFWTVDGDYLCADFHRSESCLYNCSITNASYQDLKVFVLSLYFAALELNNVSLVEEHSDSLRLRHVTGIPAHLIGQIQDMIKKSLRKSGNSKHCYSSPRFYKKAIKEVLKTYTRDPHAVPLSHFLAAMLHRVTSSRFLQQTRSKFRQLFELGPICVSKPVAAMALPCKAIVHKLS